MFREFRTRASVSPLRPVASRRLPPLRRPLPLPTPGLQQVKWAGRSAPPPPLASLALRNPVKPRPSAPLLPPFRTPVLAECGDAPAARERARGRRGASRGGWASVVYLITPSAPDGRAPAVGLRSLVACPVLLRSVSLPLFVPYRSISRRPSSDSLRPAAGSYGAEYANARYPERPP